MPIKTSQATPKITPEILKLHGFSALDYSKIKDIVGRETTLTELGIFSAMWSEHCSYKSTRIHIKKLPTKGKRVICGPGENAGIIDIDGNDAIAFKIESHNHPSYIEPFQGSTTGVGGILRDVFTMGARPIALLNSLRFGEPNFPKTKYLFERVVAGIGSYGNCIGVPTVGGECYFDKSYNYNILVNAMCVGLVQKDKIFYSKAGEEGALVMYVGSKTGRDGINAAVMASAEFDEEIESKKPTIQVGDPFQGKKVMEACLELMQEDCIIAVQDMGAAGLTSSSVEMADKGERGIEIDLDKVPKHDESMTSYEIMLSESQERMLLVIKPEKMAIAKKIFSKWEIDAEVIGKITDTKRIIIKQHNQIVADLPVNKLANSAPVYDRPYKYTPKAKSVSLKELGIKSQVSAKKIFEDLKKIFALPNMMSKKHIFEQYDYKVGNATIINPGGDAGVVRIHNSKKAVALTTDCNSRYVLHNPFEGAKQAVVETWRNITCTGAKPIAITNCLNFASPEREEVMGQIVAALEGIKEACEALNYPVVSGNASLFNETKLPNGGISAINPTPIIGGVGLLEDYSKAINSKFVKENMVIIRVGNLRGDINSSMYLYDIIGYGEPTSVPKIDLEEEKRNGEFIHLAISNGWIEACHDVSEGGQLVAIAEMAIDSEVDGKFIGAELTISTDLERCFGEDQAIYIITATEANAEIILKKAPKLGVEAVVIGKTIPTNLRIDSEVIRVQELKEIRSNSNSL
jgi:phosphoribosylformylglycinamidine synthase II